MDSADPLAAAPLLVVSDTDGNPREARIRQALALSQTELRDVHGDAISWVDLCIWDRRARRVLTRRQERFGAVVLDDRTWSDAPDESVALAMLDGVRELGFAFPPAAERLRARVSLCRAEGIDLPDMSDAALMGDLEGWLMPHLSRVRTAADWKAFDPTQALTLMLDWDQTQTLNRATPAHLVTPLGRKVPIDYSGENPEAEIRLQEMFGTTRHPTVAGRPLRLTLLSPAGRPVQTTMDLPGFWADTYSDVRKDMRARYPRHPWPENPAEAEPTLRAKPRGT